ncbi:hypothetical protein FBR04_19195 [Betaproteobacteria bacterium PRO7]|jgi:hypothetical protein|nr:hypothetical protein [Betaproteobacteria bacterium PRO7]
MIAQARDRRDDGCLYRVLRPLPVGGRIYATHETVRLGAAQAREWIESGHVRLIETEDAACTQPA